MRKIVFTIVGSMLISLCAVQAQEYDTTGTASKSKSKQNKYKTEQSRKDRNKTNKDQAWQQQSDRMGRDQAVVVIDVQEVPSNIRQKLDADEKYSGWEKATVYHNTRTGDYVFIPEPFRLDKEGNEQEMTGDRAWGYHNRYGERSQQDQDMSRQNQDMSQQSQDRSQQNQDMSSQEQTQNQDRSSSASQDQSDEQQQSSGYRTEQDQQAEQQQQQSSQGYRPDDAQYNTANMVEVQEDQVPETLRTTLQESEYEGWKESGKLYRNPSTSEYVLIIDDNSSQERRYRFDASGERVNE